MRLRRTTSCLALACLGQALIASAEVITVPGDYPTIQAAIDAAMAGDEVVVSPGTYNESIDFLGKMIVVRSVDGPEVTTIDASGLRDTVARFVSGETRSSELVGFTVTGGAPDGIGGGAGVTIENSSPTIRQCTVIDNSAGEDGGGGARIVGGDPMLSACTFRQNRAFGRGGGAHCIGGAATFVDCGFLENSADGMEGDGGGICVTSGQVTLTRCDLEDNFAKFAGGAICTWFGELCLESCRIERNSSDGGGGVWARSGIIDARDCDINQNGGGFGAGGLETSGQSQATLLRCRMSENQGLGGAGARLSGSGSIDGCSFSTNRSFGRGALVVVGSGGFSIVNTRFMGNISSSNGGALVVADATTASIVHCLFSGNTADIAGAIDASGPTTVIGCVLHANTAFSVGGLQAGVDTVVSNCVLWNNRDQTGTNESSQIGGSPQVNYTCVQGLTGSLGGVGNIGRDPRFVDPIGPDGIAGTADDDLRLFVGSPCIDAGDNLAVPEGITTDLDGNPRFVDDPVTQDTGRGEPPLVDMGVYEFAPVDSGEPGPRLWLASAGGSFLDPGNWFPDLPDATDPVVFGPDDEYVVSVTGDVSTGPLLVADGDVTLELDGATYTVLSEAEESVRVGKYVDEPSRLTLRGGALSAPSELVIGQLGVLAGDGAVLASLVNVGTLDPGLITPATMTVGGDYRQVGLLEDGTPAAGNLAIEIGSTHDVVAVAGDAALGGALTVMFDDLATIGGQERFTIMTIDGSFDPVDDAFDLSLVTGLPTGLVAYPEYTRGPGPGASVDIVVLGILGAFGFGEPDTFAVDGIPAAAVVADFDDDGFDDLAVAVPETNHVFVLLNAGTQGEEWLGFSVQTAIPVGAGPSALTAAPLDAGPSIDLAVVNTGDGTVLPLLNDGTGTFTPGTTVPVGNEPRGIAAGVLLPDDSAVDLAVTNESDDTVSILANDGNGVFGLDHTVAVGTSPGAIVAPVFEPPDGPVDLAVANTGDGTLVVLRYDDGPNRFAPFTIATTGTLAVDVDPWDIDNDKDIDLISVNRGDGTATVLLWDDEVHDFGPALAVPVGAQPSSLTTFEADGDGDRDLAIVVTDPEAVVRVFRNDLVESGLVGFTEIEDRAQGENPALVVSADVDRDGRDDLIPIAGEGKADGSDGPLEPILVLENEFTTCPADLSGNGVVDFADLLAILAAWGACERCREDLSGNGAVDFADVLIVLSLWGDCPAG